MRFWIAGPRLFGGFIRPGVSFGSNGFGAKTAHQASEISSDYVYVIAGEHGLVKVGYSNNPDARLATLQTASPHALRLVLAAPAWGNAFVVEQEAHRILGRYRASGEWFSASPELAIAAIYGAGDRLGVRLSDAPSPHKPFRINGYLFWTIVFALFYAIYIYYHATCGYSCLGK